MEDHGWRIRAAGKDTVTELCQITNFRSSDAGGEYLFQRRWDVGMVGANSEVIWEM